jgi:antitoxin HicB
MPAFRTYPLTIEAQPEDGVYLAYFPTWPGLPETWGDTYEEAVRNAEEAVTVYIETLIANGDPVPEPAVEPQSDSTRNYRADRHRALPLA